VLHSSQVKNAEERPSGYRWFSVWPYHQGMIQDPELTGRPLQGGDLMSGSEDNWSASNDDAAGMGDPRLQVEAGDWDKDVMSAAERRENELARTIEAEIIPRLLLAHMASKTMRAVREAPEPIMVRHVFTHDQISIFSDLVVRQPLKAAVDYVDALLADGMSTEMMITDVLSPTARNLGDLWEMDRLTFVDVTLGLSRLQQLLRVYGPAFEADFAPQHDGHRILLAAMPGEQHTFGMSVVEEFFRRDGWDVQTEARMSRSALLGRASDEWFDVVGLSASGDASVALLAPLIKSIRDVALNRHIRVIVGGCAFLAEPANALALGADLVACNGREAVLNVERLLDPTKNL
jgi:MerR family transcriptional regulator, light-induced transcriptional regulator